MLATHDGLTSKEYADAVQMACMFKGGVGKRKKKIEKKESRAGKCFIVQSLCLANSRTPQILLLSKILSYYTWLSPVDFVSSYEYVENIHMPFCQVTALSSFLSV